MDTKYQYSNPELWGGIECTINRVEDSFRDQLLYSGHYTRTGDIEKIATLGIKKLRYPLLWERHQCKEQQKINWDWTEQRLHTIRTCGITPIAGLVHHGSGPAFTNLLDEDFAKKLATYAFKVAIQFPWLEYFTPVNEPLTTARFSGLYGLWYPHLKDELTFIKILLNEVKAIILSMKAIRNIIPGARLVQTEDLGKTHSTSLLSYQAGFENERRWLSYDLLCGKVDRHHFFWTYLLRLGIKETDLQFFLDNNCPPDIMGFNYYVTSERYLDEQLKNYPSHTYGGNGRHVYADTEAVRAGKLAGLGTLFKEAWDRYQLPLAVTENHLSCTREEQLRWLIESWDTCCKLKMTGIDIRAFTAWSLFGAYDWKSLLTQNNNCYESGVFDLRNDTVRPTALAKMIYSLAHHLEYNHPLVEVSGWWHQNKSGKNVFSADINKVRPILIVGSTGTLGRAFIEACNQRSIPYVALSRKELNILNENDIILAIDEHHPWAIINTSGYVRIDDAELNKDECFAVNAHGAASLAKHCEEKGIRLMTFSSDLVFNGDKRSPYHEVDAIMPLNVYGSSKAESEKLVSAFCPDALIIRTSAFFGPWDKYNFVYAVLDSLKKEQPFYVPNDVQVSPTYVPDLANTTLDLFIDEEKGIWHITNEGELTWLEFATAIAARTNYSRNTVMAKSLIEMEWKAKRPLYSVLGSKKGVKMPSLENALNRYFTQRVV
jgi:dTDP-4-dehydrorhamnose reductase